MSLGYRLVRAIASDTDIGLARQLIANSLLKKTDLGTLRTSRRDVR